MAPPSSAYRLTKRGVASGGVGLIVGRDLVTGSVDVLFL